MRLRLMIGLVLALFVGSVAGVAAQEPTPGGDLVWARGRDITSLDPVPVGDTDTIYALNHLYETLYIADVDGTPIPHLATDFEISDDQLSWTFTLRDDVTFHDGTPMTSEDVKWSIERATPGLEPNPDGAAFGFINAAIESVEAPDPTTVVINTKFPWSPLLADIVGFINYILPADFGGRTEEDFFAAPVGTGPFMYDRWDPGVEFRMVKNPNYWKPGQPYLDSVTWRLVGDDNTRILQLQGGEAQVVQGPPFATLEDLANGEGTEATVFPAETTQYILLNTTQPPLDDVHVRRAIAHGIDSQPIIEAVFIGNAEPANSFVSPQQLYHDPDTSGPVYDPDLAREELAMSSVPDGFELELTTTSDFTPYLDMATIIQSQLAEVGIDVVLRPVEFTNLYATISTGDFMASNQGWTSDIPDPDEQVSFMADFVSAQSYSTNWDDPEVREWVAAAQMSFSDDERAELYSMIQERANRDVPWVNVVYQGLPYAWSSDLNDFQVYATGAYHLEDAWLSQ